jgi:hypothetical protein
MYLCTVAYFQIFSWGYTILLKKSDIIILKKKKKTDMN